MKSDLKREKPSLEYALFLPAAAGAPNATTEGHGSLLALLDSGNRFARLLNDPSSLLLCRIIDWWRRLVPYQANPMSFGILGVAS
ncbi:hypothetical protein GUJ93_ZPchr0002g24918 [Zizania palustris]|uniref:Uncharacterized protein n=1 Tax=Zizania palustris TaxID=103762 RepID=A0A8J5S8Y3_ZIZPA|nr:hypothetical protein GUJ93_ZPchr0002g24918 [Zizania palustris]